MMQLWLSAGRQRRVIAGGLAVLVGVSVPAVLLAWLNPWRYVGLMSVGRSLVIFVVVGAPVLLGIAGLLVVAGWEARRWVAVGAVVVTALLGVCGGLFVMVSDLFVVQRTATTVVAVAPGGDFEMVLLQYSTTSDPYWYEIVRIRSRAGLASRESAQDLACFTGRYAFGTARFLSDHEVEIRDKLDTPWTTTFDPRSMKAEHARSEGC